MISALDSSLLQKTQGASEGSKELESFLDQLSQTADDNAIDRVILLYEKTIVALEQDIWKNKPTQKIIQQYQNAFIVLEKLHELKTADNRFNFKIIIPVADRPKHLKHCLNSLLALCRNYGYGGYENEQFNKISVLIADDSRDINNIKLHKRYCTEFTAQGISTEYFGLEEQLNLVKNTVTDNDGLARVISESKGIDNPIDFSHKGASLMRNITYLKLNQALSQKKTRNNTLIYFIDSDQEFCVNIFNSDSNHYAINYFHYLNEIFKTQDISILTGKVVGDPPVSPSVMAGNFQQDIQNFLNTIEKLNPAMPCQFHQHETDNKDDAAYHDMASLFGFPNHEQAFDYRCTLENEHNNADCFSDFSDKLGHFFYGEHPTRKNFFHYGNGFTETTPARTVYTGNYVIKPENLDHFIPFATLKLRMAGPVLGRILNARLQHKFVSANLPMLHNRTVDSTGHAEFRAGVKSLENTVSRGIDLGDEFIRQFYGDVMLFSIKKITEQGLAYKEIDKLIVQSILDATYTKIKTNYAEKHNTVLQLKLQIQTQLKDQVSWWNNMPEEPENIRQARINFNNFLGNIESNFGENSFAYQQTSSPIQAARYLESILHAILQYQNDIDCWKKTLITE